MKLLFTHFLKFAFLPALFVIASCTPPHYMYSPTVMNVPAFTRKGESSLNGCISGHGYDIQAGYAISNHIALLGNWYWRKEWQYAEFKRVLLSSTNEFDTLHYRRKSPGLGISYFTPVGRRQKFFVTISGGYGTGYFKLWQHSVKRYPDADTILSRKRYKYNADISRLYLQPAAMIQFHSSKIIFSLRFLGLIYHNVQSTYEPGMINVIENKFYRFTEPAFTYRFTPQGAGWLTATVQIGLAIPTHDVNFDVHPFVGNLGVSIDPAKLLQKGADKKK